MKGEILFEKMTGISEEYITEAALVPALGASPAKRPENRFAALSRALNSGWGVACICFIVAIAAVVGMVAWGRMGDPTGPGSDPTVRFAFSYEMTANDGSAWSGTAMPGDIVNVSTTIVNHGKPFEAYDFFAFAQLVLQEDESVVIAGHYPVVDTDKHTVESGSTGSRAFHFHIPENATPGVYDLVLSYDGVKQVFGGALTVGDPTEEFKPPYGTNDLYVFSFGYEPYGGVPFVNSFLHLETWVRNDSEPFTFTGSSMGFAPHAVLLHRETGYRIEGMFDATTDYTEVTVNKGDVGRVNQEFFIPVDAPTGIYDLVLSFYGATQTFENVLTVSIPIAIDAVKSFSFGYELAGDALTGATYLMDTWVINEGESFTFEGSSMAFAPTASLIHMETQYRIDGSFGMDDDHGVFTVNPGDIGRVTQEFFIPTFAPTGAYALQLSYGGVSKSFPGVVIVAEPTDVDLDYPLPEDGHPFSFGYEPFGGFAIPGDWLTVKAWVINEGEPFSFFGDPNSFEPVATLHHVDSGYVIPGYPAPTGVMPRPCNVLTGQSGANSYEFRIPVDAPTGEYGLRLSYHGQEQSFEGVLTVATP